MMHLLAAFAAGASVPSRPTLSGSSGSPNGSTDLELSGTAQAGWRTLTSGELQRIVADVWTDFIDEYFSIGGVSGPPTQDLWIRATLDADDAPTTGTLNVWLKCAGATSSARTFTWEYSGVPDFLQGDLKFELATDSGGSNIVATGYYRGRAEIII